MVKSEAQLEQELNSADRAGRLHALRELKQLADRGEARVERERQWVNMHCHSTYSFNAHGFSPSRVAWECYRRGLAAGGMVDFDVLDALDETLAAGDALRYRLTVGIESRVYVKEFEKDVLNSPNEPGIAYYMGQGFTQPPQAGSPAARTLVRMAECAAARNRAIMENVNRYLGTVQIDYERDVLPLTPARKATERHLLYAYDLAAQKLIPNRTGRARFWASKVQTSEAEIESLMDDSFRFRDLLRKKLMKYGSPGYVAPDPKNFPTVAEMVEMVKACGAMPMYAWLDGTSSGEEDAELLLDFFCTNGQVALNLIPDRNWNIKDPGEKALKVANLNRIVAAARDRQLPISVGTEMNSMSQPMVDHFDSPELKPHLQTFHEGALIIWGHSLLLRHGGFGYVSKQADAAFGKDAAKKNAFFLEVGKLPPPHGNQIQELRQASRFGDAKGVVRILRGTA